MGDEVLSVRMEGRSKIMCEVVLSEIHFEKKFEIENLAKELVN